METMDEFPVGMRVLAVDDSPTCLRKLEELLRRCRYNVTTAKDAKAALEMLRERSNKFDLVISDVEMPDMDGFKLLEHVGLEMDLPVIMVSVHSDYELIMKGIKHGACDYLVKPVGLKELRNIWQHVVRYNTNPNARNSVRPSRELPPPPPPVDAHEDVSKKRKEVSQENGDDDEGNEGDGEEDEDGEGSENDRDDDEPNTRKKPRVVWASELHQKFVTAVTQLGPDKAVPKKILDLMNVEGLTRENVASHLQKYRIYLKKMDETQNHNMAAPSGYGTRDPSFFHTAQLDGYKDFHELTATRQLPISTLLPHPHAPTRPLLNLQGTASPSFIRPMHHNSPNSSVNMFGKYNSNLLSGVENVNPFQRSPLESREFPGNKFTAFMGDPKIIGGFLDPRASLGGNPSTSLDTAPSSSQMLQAKHQRPMHRILAGNQLAPSNSDPVNIGMHGLSNFSSHNRSKIPMNSFPMNHQSLSLDEMQGNSNFRGVAGNGQVDFSPPFFAGYAGGEAQCPSQMFGQDMNGLEEHRRDSSGSHMMNNGYCNNMDDLVPGNEMAMDMINEAGSRGFDGSLMNHMEGNVIANSQHVDAGKSASMEAEMRSARGFSKSDNGYINDQQHIFDDMMSELIKQDVTMDAGFGFDSFPST